VFGDEDVVCELVVLVDVPGGLGGVAAVVFEVFDHALAFVVVGEEACVAGVVDALDAVFVVPVDAAVSGLFAAALVVPA